MYIVEIKDKPMNWVACICLEKGAGERYMEEISDETRSKAVLLEVPVASFPLYAIERVGEHGHGDVGSGNNYFEFTDREGLKAILEEQRKHKVADEGHHYFTFYAFYTEHFQFPRNKSYMGIQDHVHVDNDALDDPGLLKSPFFSQIHELSANYDIEGMDALHAHFMENAGEQEKVELAEDGYLNLFWRMCYDYECNKLTDVGVNLLVHMVDMAGALTGEKYWGARANAALTLLEDACTKHSEEVPARLQSAVATLGKYREEVPEDAQEAYQKMALAYDLAANEIQGQKDGYWAEAVKFIKKSIELAPEAGDWAFYLRLVYLPFQLPTKNTYTSHADGQKTVDAEIAVEEGHRNKYQGRELSGQQKAEQALLAKFMEKHALISPKMPFIYALSYYRLWEHLDWYKLDGKIFPEAAYTHWLDKASDWEPGAITHIDLNEAVHFFHSEGQRLGRVDLLEKAIGFYQRVLQNVEDAAFEVYYTANAYKHISEIYQQKGVGKEADLNLAKAIEVYENHADLVKSNPSVSLHFAEFMEYCFHYPGDIKKPGLDGLKTIARETEDKDAGYISAPTMMRLRLALLENREEEAIYHLTKLLVLHELCIDKEVKALLQQYENSPFEKFKKFVKDTLTFMQEVDANYYLDTEVKWEELKAMPPLEVAACWEKRKQVLRDRPPLDLYGDGV